MASGKDAPQLSLPGKLVFPRSAFLLYFLNFNAIFISGLKSLKLIVIISVVNYLRLVFNANLICCILTINFFNFFLFFCYYNYSYVFFNLWSLQILPQYLWLLIIFVISGHFNLKYPPVSTGTVVRGRRGRGSACSGWATSSCPGCCSASCSDTTITRSASRSRKTAHCPRTQETSYTGCATFTAPSSDTLSVCSGCFICILRVNHLFIVKFRLVYKWCLIFSTWA